METILGPSPVWSTISRIQEVHEQADWDTGKHGEVHAVTGEGDGQICGEGYSRSRFAGSPNPQVSGPVKRLAVISLAIFLHTFSFEPFAVSTVIRQPEQAPKRGPLFDLALVISLTGVWFMRHWPLAIGDRRCVCHIVSQRSNYNFLFNRESHPLAGLTFLAFLTHTYYQDRRTYHFDDISRVSSQGA